MNQMNDATKRSILRWIHIVFGIPILGYIYSPFEEIPNYAPAVRFVFLPVIVLSGFWMWKGHVLRRLISKRLAQHDAAANRPQAKPHSVSPAVAYLFLVRYPATAFSTKKRSRRHEHRKATCTGP
jgi:hypothetical protein